MPRLALCHVCDSVTRLPDPPSSAPLIPARWEWVDDAGKTQEYFFRDEGGQQVMVAKYDPSLEDWVSRHEHPDIPNEAVPHKHDLWSIDQLTWQATDVVATARKSMMESTGRMYAERDELKDEAMKCFQEHHRPKDSCADVFSESRVIGNHESNQRMPPNERLFLCHLCPFVHGYVMPQVRSVKLRRAERRAAARRR